jgi:hypothetical protein
MTITPLELLDTSIGQLQTLVAFLDDQLSWTESTALEACACKEIARSLCSLIRTHEAARHGSSQEAVERTGEADGNPKRQELVSSDFPRLGRASHEL